MSTPRIAVVAVVALAALSCTPADAPDVAAAAPDPPRTPAAAAPSVLPSPPTERQLILDAYRTYTRLASEALSRGKVTVDGLDRVVSGSAARDLRARIRANDRAGVRAEGQLVPSASDADIRWDGGSTARLTDCVLNGLAHVSGTPADVVEEATGTRRPVAATLRRIDGRWTVRRVALVQDPEADNVQQDPPFLRGPMPDGPPSCAPPDLEREILAGYRDFWDAFDRAFGFGRAGPANPDDPALAATSVNPQLSDTRRYLRRLANRNKRVEGSPDLHDSTVLALTRFDTVAFVADCRTLGSSFVLNESNGQRRTQREGQVDYDVTRMKSIDEMWKVANWDTEIEDVQVCELP